VDVMQRALAGAADPEIVACEAALRAVRPAADAGALDRLIADGLLFTGPDGQLAARAQDRDAHPSGAVRFVAHEPGELHVRRIGTDVVVAALRARLTVDVAIPPSGG
jgi:hypothetical protein